MSGLGLGLGLAGQSCGVNILVGLLLAYVVVFGQGCVDVWLGVCFALMLVLFLASVIVRCLVWIFGWAWLVRVAVSIDLLVFPLQTLLGLGWVDCMCLCVCVFGLWASVVLCHVLVGRLVGAGFFVRCWDLTRHGIMQVVSFKCQLQRHLQMALMFWTTRQPLTWALYLWVALLHASPGICICLACHTQLLRPVLKF